MTFAIILLFLLYTFLISITSFLIFGIFRYAHRQAPKTPKYVFFYGFSTSWLWTPPPSTWRDMTKLLAILLIYVCKHKVYFCKVIKHTEKFNKKLIITVLTSRNNKKFNFCSSVWHVQQEPVSNVPNWLL